MSKEDRYLHTFNELADLLRYGDLINSYCRSQEDCDKTVDLILCITERMQKLIKLMEE